MVARITRCFASLILAVLIGGALLPRTASAQAAYPTKAITLVTPWAVGGANDVLCRITAKYLSAELGVPVNVVNRPGGNQVVGILSVLQSAPDGYTLLSEFPGSGAGQAIMKDLPYKWDDRTFGPMVTSSPLAFVVNGKSPWKTLKEAADAAKKDPASFTWGFLGGTANTDISTVQLLDAVGADLAKTRPVPMAGSGPSVTAIAGNHIVFGNAGVSAAFPLLSSGNIKILAVTSDQRMASLPDVPTTKEAGFPDVNITTYSGISGPKGMPKNVVDTLDRALKKVTENPAYAKELQALGNDATFVSSEETYKRVQRQAEIYRAALAKLESIKK